MPHRGANLSSELYSRRCGPTLPTTARRWVSGCRACSAHRRSRSSILALGPDGLDYREDARGVRTAFTLSRAIPSGAAPAPDQRAPLRRVRPRDWDGRDGAGGADHRRDNRGDCRPCRRSVRAFRHSGPPLSSGANPVVTFPITGGSTSSTGDLIEHNGSGLRVTVLILPRPWIFKFTWSTRKRVGRCRYLDRWSLARQHRSASFFTLSYE